MAGTQEAVNHPCFARLYGRISAQADDRGGAQHRHTLLEGLTGRVVEVGAGNGRNFSHYPEQVTEVVAVEPEQHLRKLAVEAAGRGPVPIRVVDGVASRLAAADGSFDAGVASLVLCSVPDQTQALCELFRVLRPGAELRFYEHVIAKRPLAAKAMRLSDATFWPRIAGGCHMARDTAAAIEDAGFVIERCDRFGFSPGVLLPSTPHLLGMARRP